MAQAPQAWWLVTALAVSIAGCGRSPEPAAGTESPAAVAPAGDAASGSGTALEAGAADVTPDAPSAAEMESVLAALTQAVRRYGLEQRQVPASLEDLVAKGYLSQVPEAPRGQQFRITKQLQVVLSND